MLLYPYQYPAFSTFSLNGISSTLEVGTSIPFSKTFVWSTSNSSNILSNSIHIRYTYNNVIYDYPGLLEEGYANDGSEIIVGEEEFEINYLSPNSQIFTISAQNSNEEYFTKNTTIVWKYKIFHGTIESDPVTSEDIRGLATNLFDTNSFSITIDDVKYVIAIPSTKTLQEVRTSNFEDITNNFIESTIDVELADGVTTNQYKIYTLTTALPLDIIATVTLE